VDRISTGSSFNYHPSGPVEHRCHLGDLHVGDFNHDGKADITGGSCKAAPGGPPVTGSSFSTRQWGIWRQPYWWTSPVPTSITDKFTDIVGRVSATGQWWAPSPMFHLHRTTLDHLGSLATPERVTHPQFHGFVCGARKKFCRRGKSQCADCLLCVLRSIGLGSMTLGGRARLLCAWRVGAAPQLWGR